MAFDKDEYRKRRLLGLRGQQEATARRQTKEVRRIRTLTLSDRENVKKILGVGIDEPGIKKEMK